MSSIHNLTKNLKAFGGLHHGTITPANYTSFVNMNIIYSNEWIDLSTLIICSIAELILIIFLILWIQQICCVIDRNSYHKLCRTLFIILSIILAFIFNLLFCAINLLNHWTLEVGYLSIQQIFWIIGAIAGLVSLHVFKLFMNQWFLHYVRHPRLNRRNTMTLNLIQFIFSIIIIVIVVFAIIDNASPNPTASTDNHGYIFASVYCICIALSALAFVIILKQMQRILQNVRITDENRMEIRSSQRLIKISLIVTSLCIIWNLCASAYAMGEIYMKWPGIKWIWAICWCGLELVFGVFWLLLGYQGRDNTNTRSICNCMKMKPGLIGDSTEFRHRFILPESSSLIQVQGK